MNDTTIHISGYVKDELEEIKEEEDHKSFDSVVRTLLWQRKRLKNLASTERIIDTQPIAEEIEEYYKEHGEIPVNEFTEEELREAKYYFNGLIDWCGTPDGAKWYKKLENEVGEAIRLKRKGGK